MLALVQQLVWDKYDRKRAASKGVSSQTSDPEAQNSAAKTAEEQFPDPIQPVSTSKALKLPLPPLESSSMEKPNPDSLTDEVAHTR